MLAFGESGNEKRRVDAHEKRLIFCTNVAFATMILEMITPSRLVEPHLDCA